MSFALLLSLGFLTVSLALLGWVLREGKKLDALDPRVGKIVYEDVDKPALVGYEPPADFEPATLLTYVDNDFQAQPNGQYEEVSLVIQGYADRIIRRPNGDLHILDFKSGTSGKPGMDGRSDKPDKSQYYRYQIAAYFLMIEQLWGEKPARGVLDFVDGVGDFVEFENSPEIRKEVTQLARELVEVKLGAIPQEILDALRQEDARQATFKEAPRA